MIRKPEKKDLFMRRLILSTLLFLGVVVAIQPGILSMQNIPAEDRKNLQISTPEGINVSLSALTASRIDQVLHLKGSVTIRTKDMILHADEADYDERTAEIALRGNASVKLESYK
jgi:lipopolysaccharide assembly outer membrane protein LptD (OstA)